MLEYFLPAQPASLCNVFPLQLQRYYNVPSLALLRDSIQHRHLYAANEGCFIEVKGNVLFYRHHQGALEVVLDFEPVAVGVRRGKAFLLDEWGWLWCHTRGEEGLTNERKEVLTISSNATGLVDVNGVGWMRTADDWIKVESEKQWVGTASAAGNLMFCDDQEQWYWASSLRIAAPSFQHCIHTDNTVHYIRGKDTLCWLSADPLASVVLMEKVKKISGNEGSVYAEGKDGCLVPFLATYKL